MTEKKLPSVSHRPTVESMVPIARQEEIRRQFEDYFNREVEPLPTDVVVLRDLAKKIEDFMSGLLQIQTSIRRLGMPYLLDEYVFRLEDMFNRFLPARISRHFDSHEKYLANQGLVPLMELIIELHQRGMIDDERIVSGYTESLTNLCKPYEALLDRIEVTLNHKAELREVQRMYQLGLIERISDSMGSPWKPEAKKLQDACHHNEDYTSVCWYGQEFVFSEKQAKVVKALWENDLPLSNQSIRTECESEQLYISGLFKDRNGLHPAWKKMIVGAGKGKYRINFRSPEDR